MRKFLQILIIVFLLTISSSGFVLAKKCGGLKCLPPLVFALDDDGPPEDVILLTQITLDIGNDGYEDLPFGISNIYSEIELEDNHVTVVIHYGDVEIILSEESEKIAIDFVEDLKKRLEERDVEVKITWFENLLTEDLTELYEDEEKDEPIKPEPIIEPIPESIVEPEPEVEEMIEPEPEPTPQHITDEQNDEIIEEKPYDFFSKIFNWIKNLFS